jgi:hypothetical protein
VDTDVLVIGAGRSACSSPPSSSWPAVRGFDQGLAVRKMPVERADADIRQPGDRRRRHVRTLLAQRTDGDVE